MAAGTVTASRKITIKGETPNQNITLGHLKALVNLAAADGYPDDALVVTPAATNGLTAISVREGE